MKASYIQTQIGLNAQVLTGLYEEIANLRKSRKMFNERADCFANMAMIADDAKEQDRANELFKNVEDNREQATVFTPYINKFAKRIKAVEQVQKALKHELKTKQWQEQIIYGLVQVCVAEEK